MTKRFAEQGEYTEGMGPGDDYFTAPFALASGWTRKTASRLKEQAIKLCFTAYEMRERSFFRTLQKHFYCRESQISTLS